jgi:hypothetical protein
LVAALQPLLGSLARMVDICFAVRFVAVHENVTTMKESNAMSKQIHMQRSKSRVQVCGSEQMVTSWMEYGTLFYSFRVTVSVRGSDLELDRRKAQSTKSNNVNGIR